MKLSFIVTSIDKDKELQKCVESIEKAHEYRKDIEIEILLVIQDSQENKTIETEYSKLATSYYIYKTGLSTARNFAIKKSKGDFLVFVDDDAEIKEDFIDVLIKNINGAETFCGRILDPIDKQAFSRCFIYMKKKYLNRCSFRYFMGSSHVLKKNIFEEIGLYDENFGIGAKYRGAEESDMFFRLLKKNKRILYIPELIFYHPVSYKISASRAFNYAYAVGAMLTKQIIIDKSYFFIYIFLIFEILFKSLVRTIQSFLFWGSIRIKNKQFRYRSVFGGTISGIINYLSDGTKNKA